MKVLNKPSTTLLTLARVINKILYLLSEAKKFCEYTVLANSLRQFGANVRLDDGVLLIQPDNISIGDEVFIGRNTIFHAYAPINIGSHTVIAAGCKLISANHRFDDPNTPINDQGHDYKSIILEDDVWLGYGVIVLPGVHLGKGCVVGAGSVVTKSFEPYSVLAGVPAKLLKQRHKSDVIC